jgi:hypothetical protein
MTRSIVSYPVEIPKGDFVFESGIIVGIFGSAKLQVLNCGSCAAVVKVSTVTTTAGAIKITVTLNQPKPFYKSAQEAIDFCEQFVREWNQFRKEYQLEG